MWKSKVGRYLVVAVLLTALPRAVQAADRSGPDGTAAPAAGPGESVQVTLRASLASAQFSEFPVAVVNDEGITLDDLKNTMGMSHAQLPAEVREARKIDFAVFLDRLITVRLFTQEARSMGIADLPEIRSSLERFSDLMLKRHYELEIVKDVKADDAEIERKYRENIREWKINSVLFLKEEDAKKMAAAVKAGTTFEDAARQALREGAAQGPGAPAWVRGRTLQPQAAAALSAMKPGGTSGIITMGAGKGRTFSLIKLEEVRYPDDAEERAMTAADALAGAKMLHFQKHREALVKKYARIDTRLLKSLDYEAKTPGIDRLAKDQRVLAVITDADPVRVADLTAALKKKFFHGMEQAARGKKINREKQPMLQDLLERAVVRREALQTGIDRRKEYTALVKESETTALFGAFIAKVVQPEVTVSREEQEAYYREHRDQFMTQASMKLSGISFNTAADAERALKKMKQGADLGWMREHADGRPAGEAARPARWDGELTMLSNLPPEIAGAVAGAQAGDLRIAGSAEGTPYVISVTDVVPGRALPFEVVASAIEKEMFGEKLNRAVEAWSAKLRSKSDITINLVEYRH